MDIVQEARKHWWEIVESDGGECREMGIFRELADEVERLRERLEMTHVWQFIEGKKVRVKVEPGSIPDGIECRDETIRLQDEHIERLRAQLRRALKQASASDTGEEREKGDT